MKKITINTLINSALLAVMFTSVTSFANSPKDILDDISKESINVVDKDKGESSRVKIRNYIDFETLAKDSLGKEWTKRKVNERSDFKNTLQEIIERTVFPKAPEFFKNTSLEIKEEKIEKDKAYLKSSVKHNEKSAIVEFWFRKDKDSWKVIDLAIEEERWVNNLKDQFSEIIQQKSYTDLLAKMKKKLNELKTKKEY